MGLGERGAGVRNRRGEASTWTCRSATAANSSPSGEKATASGGGTKPGAEAEKTSLLVSKRRCIGLGVVGEAATRAAVAAADFLWRRRGLRDEARASEAMSAVARPLGSPPTCATGIIFADGRWVARASRRDHRRDLGVARLGGVDEGRGEGLGQV
jgi:hypothetical protein